MKNFVTLFAIVSLLFLSACGGRKAAPVQTVKSNDVNLSCQQIELELISNNDQIKRLLQEHGKTVGNNVGIGALSLLLFPPMLLAMDLKGAAKQEANVCGRPTKCKQFFRQIWQCDQVLTCVRPLDAA